MQVPIILTAIKFIIVIWVNVNHLFADSYPKYRILSSSRFIYSLQLQLYLTSLAILTYTFYHSV